MISDLIQLIIDEPVWLIPMFGVFLIGLFGGRYIIKRLRNRK